MAHLIQSTIRSLPKIIKQVPIQSAKTATRALSTTPLPDPIKTTKIATLRQNMDRLFNQAMKEMDLIDLDEHSFTATSEKNLPVDTKPAQSYTPTPINTFTPFSSQDNAVKWTKKAAEISRLRPVLLTGPSGTGKTQIIKEVAKEQNTSLVRNVFSPYTSREDLFGQYQQVKDDTTGLLTFKFVDSPLVTAMKTGQWYLADEINLASATTLSALNDFLASDRTSFTNPISGESFKVHKNFRFFAACNPAESTTGRNQFSKEFQDRFNVVEVPPPSREDLLNFFEQKAPHIPLPLASKIIDFHLHISKMAESHDIGADGDSYAFSFRTLEKLVNRLKALSDKPNTISEGKAFFDQIEHLYLSPIRSEEDKTTIKHFMNTAFDHYDERLERTIDPDVIYDDDSNDVIEVDLTKVGHNVPPTSADPFVIGDSVRHTLNQVAWAIQHNENILLVSETGMGKTSLLKFLGELRDQHTTLVSIDEHTQPEDLFGHFVMGFDADTNEKTYTWKDGPVTTALKEGHLLIIDEINKANPAVLERLNDVLDSGKVVLYEKGDADPIEADKHFQVAATANPSSTGDYACNDLSDPFKARFTIINISDPLTNAELVHLTKELLDHAQLSTLPQLLVDLYQNQLIIDSIRHLKDCIYSLNLHPELTVKHCTEELTFLCDINEEYINAVKKDILKCFLEQRIKDCESLLETWKTLPKSKQETAQTTIEEFTAHLNTQTEESHEPEEVSKALHNITTPSLKKFYEAVINISALEPSEKAPPTLEEQYHHIEVDVRSILNNLKNTSPKDLIHNKDKFVIFALYHAINKDKIGDITDVLALLFLQCFLKTNDDTPLKLLCHNPSDKLIQRLKAQFNYWLYTSDDPKEQDKALIQLAERLGQTSFDQNLEEIALPHLQDRVSDAHLEANLKGQLASYDTRYINRLQKSQKPSHYKDPTIKKRVEMVTHHKPQDINYQKLIIDCLIKGKSFNHHNTAFKTEALNLAHEYCLNIERQQMHYRSKGLQIPKEHMPFLIKSIYKDLILSPSTEDRDHLILNSDILKLFGEYVHNTWFDHYKSGGETCLKIIINTFNHCRESIADDATPTTHQKIEQLERSFFADDNHVDYEKNIYGAYIQKLKYEEQYNEIISKYIDEEGEDKKIDTPPQIADTLQHPDFIQTVIKEIEQKLS